MSTISFEAFLKIHMALSPVLRCKTRESCSIELSTLVLSYFLVSTCDLSLFLDDFSTLSLKKHGSTFPI